jgi:DmsE family decaheme c-type cytochrome
MERTAIGVQRGEAMRTLTLLLLVACAAFGQREPKVPERAPTFVGSNVCQSCHPDVSQKFYKNPHFKSVASGKEPADHTGCEGCHGPASAHVEALGGKTTIPRAFSLMTPKAAMDTCLNCHKEDVGKSNIQRSDHTQNDVVCTSCHSIHKSSSVKYLLAKQQNELCYGCHASVRAQFSMPFKHRVNEGFMTCSDCHNPHGTFNSTWAMGQQPHLAKQVLGSDNACLKCHVEKRGPFVFEHAPVRVEGCDTCHMPHGSTNGKLLRRPVVFTVCLECHNGADNFGTRNDGVPLQTSRHNMLDPKYQKCTTCHVLIHGSNSDAYFRR